MAKRFHSTTFYTQAGNTCYIEVHDTDHVGASTEFSTGPDGFELSYNGEENKKKGNIIASECTFSFFVNSTTHQALVDDISTAKEGRFRIKIYKNSSFWWCGRVVSDNGNFPDLETYFFSIQATDGIGTLSKIDYNNDGDKYTGYATLLEHLHTALDKTGLLDFGWGASDVCITTVDNWYENSHTVSAANDPLVLTRVQHRVFYTVDKKGKYRYSNCLNVIKQVLQSRNSYLIQSAGAWRVVQYPEMINATVIERRYDRAGAYLSNNATADYTKTLDQDISTAAKENIVDFTWLPPLRKVTVTYNAQNWVNYIAGAEWSNTNATTYDIDAIDDNSNGTTLRFSATIGQSLANGGFTPTEAINIFYKVKLKVGTKYLRRSITSTANYNVTYENPTWTDNAGDNYFFHFQIGAGTVPANGGSHPVDPGYIDFTTPVLEESGEGTIQLEDVFIKKLSNGQPVSALTLTYSSTNATLGVLTNSDPITDQADYEYVATNDNGGTNTEDIELNVVFGDGTNVNTIGRLEVYDGADWTNASLAGSAKSWQVGGAGDSYYISDLLAVSILAGQKTPTLVLSGDIYDTAGDYQPHHRIDDNSSDAIWVVLNATYNARNERWTGDWFYIADSPTDITSTDPVAVDPGPPNFGPYDPSNTTDPVGPSTGPNFGNYPPLIGPGVQDPGGITGGIGSVLGGVKTNINIPTGSVTSITTDQTLNAGAYNTGDVVTVIDPITGLTQDFTVTADTQQGDTVIYVQGYASGNFPVGSYILYNPQNGIVQGYGAGTTGSTSNTQTSNWWDIFQQWWEVDNTNSIDWPIEAPNVYFETDENAGNGATAGLRFDGDGLQSWDNSNTDPGVKIGLDGKLELNNLDTGTSSDILIIESGIVKKKTESAGVTDHGALTGLGDDDHTQYHNDTRGDARYYTKTQLDAGQLDGQYYQESEHISTSVGAGDAGKPIVLDAGGKVDASMIEDSDIDHGSLTGLGDDDHTQYTKNTGRAGGQTIQGGTGASDDLTLESTTNATKGQIILSDDVVGSSGFDFRTDQNAGDGATAGVTLKDTTGINVYNSSSATARAAFLQNGNWEVRTVSAATNGVVIGSGSGISLYLSSSLVASMNHVGQLKLGWATLPTEHANGFVVLSGNGVIHTDTDGAGTAWQPNFGHIKKFDVLGFSTAWSTGVVNGPFWSVTSEYAGYEVWAIGWGIGNSKGTGTGSNTCKVEHYDGTTTTTIYTVFQNPGGNTSNKVVSMTNYPTLAAHDRIYFDVSAVSATTPAQGLYVELYLRKA